MNPNKKAMMAMVMVLMMLVVPLTVIQQSDVSDAGTVAPTPSHYAYRVTYTTESGTSQSQIGTVTNLLTSTDMTAVSHGESSIEAGSWGWSSTTGLGPFNMFYAAISTGQTDSGALSETAGHVAYILDPADLTKAVKGKEISSSTSISSVMSMYNIMLVIPTVYWYSDGAGNLYISDAPDSSELPSDDVRSNMKAYAHQVDNGTVYPYLAIGVYEAKYNSTYGLMSQTGGNPTVSKNLATFRSYADKANDLIEDDCGTYTLWNFYEWTLYKILAQTVIGNKNAQSVIGYGIASGSSPGTIGATNGGGPYVGTLGTDRSDSKLFIESAWGSVWEFVDNTYVSSNMLKAGSGLHPTLAYAGTNSHSGDIDGYDYTGGSVSIPTGKNNNIITSTYTASAYWDVPSDASGTGTSGYATGDNMWSAANDRCLIVGGSWASGASAGLSAWSSSHALSDSSTAFGARLAYMMTAGAAGTGTSYTVSFEETQSSRTTSTNVSPGDSVLLPTVKPVTGYDFAGWYSDSQCTQEYIGPAGSYFKPVGSTTLYSKFVESDDYYTVHVSKGNAGSTADYDMYVKKGESMVLPAAADITGYTFSGWYTGASSGTLTNLVGMPGQYYTPSADIYLSPKYTAISYYTVTLMVWDGDGSATSDYDAGSTISVVQGDSITLPNAKYFANYQLNYWATYSSEFTQVGTYGQPYTPGATVSLYPIYGPLESGLTYSVTIMDTSNGSSYTDGDVVKVQQGSSIRLPSAPTIANKVFDHWSTYTTLLQSDDLGITGQFYQPSAAVKIAPVYADAYSVAVQKVTSAMTEATLTYDTDYTLKIASGDSILLPTAAVKDGYALTGWSLTGNSAASIGAPGSYYFPASASISLYPIYSESSASGYWTVKLYQKDESTYQSIIVSKGYPLMLPDGRSESGYTFTEWATRSGESPDYTYTSVGTAGQYYAPADDVSLYSRYAAVTTQTLTLAYLKDGESSSASDLSSYITASLSSTTVSGDGYVYLVINKTGVCEYSVSANHSYVVPLVDGLYRLYLQSSDASTVTVSVTTEFIQGYGWFNITGIANQGRSVQVSMTAANDAGLLAGTMDIGGVYCRYDGDSATWVYGSIENLASVESQAVAAGAASFSGTFSLPSGYSVYYVYGIYTATGDEPQYSGGQIGPAMPTLENSS